jgi:uncharacterized DUF497 family protein
MTIFDSDHSEAEDRWVTLGKTNDGVLLVVVHTFQEHQGSATVRVISTRKATMREQHQYEEY